MEGINEISLMNVTIDSLNEEEFNVRRKSITNGIMWNFFNLVKKVLILLGRKDVKPDFVDDILERYGSVEVIDHYESPPQPSDNNLSFWKHTVLIFEGRNAAEYAAGELRSYPGYGLYFYISFLSFFIFLPLIF